MRALAKEPAPGGPLDPLVRLVIVPESRRAGQAITQCSSRSRALGQQPAGAPHLEHP